MYIQPDITCNPTSGLASKQIAKLDCFSLPALGSNGPRNLPYIKLGAFWGSDLAIGKTFRIGEKQNLRFALPRTTGSTIRCYPSAGTISFS